MANQWTAETLKDSLCRQLRSEHCFAVCEASLGRGRVDVLALRKTFMTMRPVCYEIKVSRGDFMQDIRAEKWRKYSPYGLVAFAVPEGLVKKEEVPKEAALRIRYSTGWRWVKHGLRTEPTGPYRAEFFTRLLLCVGDQYYARGQAAGGWRNLDTYKAAIQARKEYARNVMAQINRADELRADIERLEHRREVAMDAAHEAERRAIVAWDKKRPHRVLA